MCFKNLPIEFDAQGNATLKPGVANPYTYVETPAPTPIEDDPARMRELMQRNGAIRRVDFDPVTRVAGALAFHTVVDLESRQVMETASMATLFRGYEVILKGRDPRDAIYISSRACGVCGGVHATCSALCCEMAFDIKPPPMGVVARNLLLSIEYLYDHPIHLSLLAGPDFSEPAVRETNPEIWERALNTRCPSRAVHGYEFMSEIMTDLTPLTGKLYLEGLHYTRVAREAYVLIGGKYPHPQTVVPGGVSTTIDQSDLNEIMLRVIKYFDYGRKTVGIWNDLVEFFYEVNPKYRDVGSRPKNMIEPGQWDDPYVYDAKFTSADDWGRARWAPAGVIVDGELVTTSMQMLNAGVEEFVEHAFYEEWTGAGNDEHYKFKTDPAGNPLSPHHPWNKETIPKPTGTNWKEKYSWSTAPRWDRLAMETGAYSRLWVAAVAPNYQHGRFIHPTGTSLQVELPKANLNGPIEWHVPEQWGAFERDRARAYCILYTAAIAYDNLLLAQDLLRKGGPDAKTSTPFKVPKDYRMGAGLWGAGRGYLTHHMVMDKGLIENYQILTPSTWMASPKDPFGNPGPYEEAVLSTPLLENYEKPEDFKGIDVLRAIRSFDPCMPCTTHIHTDDRTISREIITCACGADDGDHQH
ncbi:MAG TPA: nickel-dependent hydrogenase large subunit [Solirubrobacteraceae bacterium]|jgi:hydrogenase large subunit|nr:nickel-dependent hydrogenase large subunit [Solirubrobacteraceae bacterium]